MIQSRTRVTAAACIALGAFASVALAAPDAAAPAPQASAAASTTLTPEQRQALRDELARYLRQDAEGLIARMRPDGAVLVGLEGRYQHAVVARPIAGGGRELACFDDPDLAVAFLARDDRRAGPTSSADRKPQPEERDR